MDVEDFAEPEVAVAAAVTAALFSKRVRGLLRRGAVYGVTGAILTGKAVQAMARGVEENARQLATAAAATIEEDEEDEEEDEPTSARSNAKASANGASSGARARSRSAH